jgi:hypothetical protein
VTLTTLVSRSIQSLATKYASGILVLLSGSIGQDRAKHDAANATRSGLVDEIYGKLKVSQD